MPSEITIPPLLVLPVPHTNAQGECYADRAEDYLAAVLLCYKTGGPNATIQTCITSAHNDYVAGIGICDTL